MLITTCLFCCFIVYFADCSSKSANYWYFFIFPLNHANFSSFFSSPSSSIVMLTKMDRYFHVILSYVKVMTHFHAIYFRSLH